MPHPGALTGDGLLSAAPPVSDSERNHVAPQPIQIVLRAARIVGGVRLDGVGISARCISGFAKLLAGRRLKGASDDA